MAYHCRGTEREYVGLMFHQLTSSLSHKLYTLSIQDVGFLGERERERERERCMGRS